MRTFYKLRQLGILLVILFSIFGTKNGFGQTTLIDPTGDGGFETGSTFPLNGWTVVNGSQTNKWEIGTAATGYLGSRCAYISNDAGVSNSFTNSSASIVHFYRDIAIPVGESNIQLTFWIKGIGESTYDRLRVYDVATSTSPAAGTELTSGQVGLVNYNAQGEWIKCGILIASGEAGTTRRIVFSWRNDGSGGTNPAIAIENIQMISQTPSALSGTYTIDNTNPTSGTNFNDFVDAILTINSVGISSSVTFNVSADQVFYNLNPAITATGTSTNTITFQKTGAGANPIIKTGGQSSFTTPLDAGISIAGGDYFTFDGIDIQATTNATYNYVEAGYYIYNASSTNGAQNNTIKNCKITLNRANTYSVGIYQYTAITPTNQGTGNNNNNKYYNITVENSYTGVYLRGASSTYYDTGCEFGVTAGGSSVIGSSSTKDIGNGASAVYGVRASYQSGVKIFGTTIRNANSTSYSARIAGLFLENSYGTSEIYNNQIGPITVSSSTASTTNYLVVGMRLDVASGHTVNVYNNMIFSMSTSQGTGTSSAPSSVIQTAGIVMGVTAGTTNLYNNSIRISGTYLNTACILSTGGTANTMKLKNNNLSNNTAAQSGTPKHYCFMRQGSSGTINTSDYNNYYIPNTGNGYVGYYTADKAALSDWQAALTKDGNSKSVDAGYTSNSNLHSNSATLNGAGVPIATGSGDGVTISTDIEGEARHASTPDIGADEYSLAAACTTPISPADGAVDVAQTASLSWNTATNATGYKVHFGTDNPPTNIVNGTSQVGTTYTPASLNATTQYFWKIVPTSSEGDATGCSVWNFTTQSAVPSLSVSSSLAAFGSHCLNTSTVNSFTINGLNLNDAIDVVINSLTDFAYSTSAGGPFTSTLNITPSGGVINNQVIYVQFTPTTAGTYSGSIEMNGGGLSSSVYEATSGTGIAALGGTNTVGSAGTYATLTAAVDAYNTATCFSGNVVFSLTDATYSSSETFPITINANANAGTYTLTIKPAASNTATITGSVASGALIKLNGADYIIFDGSNSGGTDRNLTITNSSATAPTVIWVASSGTGSGATNNNIKNCIINTGLNTSGTYGIFAGGTSIGTAGDDNDYLTIQNNVVTKAYFGVYVVANATGLDNNLTISNNTIGTTTSGSEITYNGIWVSQVSDANIFSNTIKNLYATASVNPIGINIQAGTINSNFYNNSISDVNATATGGYGGRGIQINTGSLTSNLTLYNNIIWNIKGTGWSSMTSDVIAGIIIGNLTSTTGGINLYYNTVNLGSGSFTGHSSGTLSGAFVVAQSGPANLDVRNNIFSTNLFNSAAAAAKTYAIYSGAANTAFTNINYNSYYVSGAQGVLGYLSSDRTDLAGIQAGFGQNVNSIASDPLFNSSSNLILQSGSPAAGAGTNISGISTDYSGVSRNATTPSMGAYENTGDFVGPTISYTTLTNTGTTSNRVLTGFATIADASGVNTTTAKPRLYFKKLTDNNTYVGNTSSDNGWKYVEASNASSPFDFTIDYSKINGGSVTAADVVQYFVVAQDNAATPNVNINSGTFNAAPSSVALAADAFPLTGTINSYTILTSFSGTYNVGTGQTYTSLTNAGGFFAAINAGSVSSNIQVNITSDITETGANSLNQWSEDGAGNYTFLIQPDAATIRTLSGSYAGGLINLNGADRVTIDGRYSGSGSYLAISNTNTSGSVVKFINDATANIVRNCDLTGVGTTVANSVVVFSTTIGTTGNDDNTISYNKIHSGATVSTSAIYSLGTSAKENSNITISNNEIYDFWLANGISYGINVNNYSTSWTISNNSLYQTATRTSSAAATIYPIYIYDGTGYTISGNYIGGSSASCGGTAWTVDGSFANVFSGLYLNQGATKTASIQSNTIKNFNFTSTSTATTGIGVWSAIFAASGDLSIGNSSANTIGDNSSTSITITAGAGTALVNGISVASIGTSNISNNAIGGFDLTGGATVGYTFKGIASSGSAGNFTIGSNTVGSAATSSNIKIGVLSTTTAATSFIGIDNSATGTISITNNTIAHAKANGTGASGQLAGIKNSGGIATITSNTIRNLDTYSSNVGTGASSSIVGVSQTSTTAGSHTVGQNVIYSIKSYDAAAAVKAIGIYYSGPASGTNAISRNFVHSFDMETSSSTAVLTGIEIGGGVATTSNNMIRLGIDASGTSLNNDLNINGLLKSITANNDIYFNSIYIGGSAVVSTSAVSFGFRRTATGTDVFRNNIIVNNRNNSSGSGKHYTIGIDATTTFTINNNVYNATGTGANYGLVGATDYATFANWKLNNGSNDGSSADADPFYRNPTGDVAALDLHISLTSPTSVEGSASSGTGILVDFDGDTRSSSTPEDIGADAGDFTSQDIIAPSITYTTLVNTTSTSDRNLTGVTITDASGVNVDGGSNPRIYYKKSTDDNTFAGNTSGDNGWKYAETTSASSPFSFTIDYSLLQSAVTAEDIIQYFIVAQDMASPENIGINSGNFSNTPTSVDLDASSFPISGTINEYRILTQYSGTYTVGAGNDFTNLTSSLTAMDAGEIVGAIVFELTSNYVSSGETFPLTFKTSDLPGISAANTITVRPASGVTATITGSEATIGLIVLDAVNYITFDGRDGGSGSNKNLTIINTSTAVPVFKYVNDASNNIVKYAVIKGRNTSTTGVMNFSTTTGTTGNDNNTIDYCNISSDGSNYPVNLVYSLGTSAKENTSNTVSNCNLFDYRGANSSAVNISSYSTDYVISGNSVYQTSPYAGVSGTSYGFYISNTSGNNFSITGNYIGGSAASCGSSAWTVNGAATTYRFVGIYTSVGTATPSSVQNNTIKNIVWLSSTATTTAPGDWCGIYSYSGNTNIGNVTGNTIGSTLSTGSLSLTISSTPGAAFGIVNSAASSTLSISNNTVSGIDVLGSSTSISHGFYGIYNSTGTSITINNNTIGSTTTANSINAITSSTVTGESVYGIYNLATGTINITNNTIANLNNNNSYTTSSSAGIIGVYSSSGTNTITGNSINNFTTTNQSQSTTSSASLVGIYFSNSSYGGTTISSNTIHSLRNTYSSTRYNYAYGIYYYGSTSGTNTISKNNIHSIELNNTNTSSNTYGIYVGYGTSTYSNNFIRVGIKPDGTALTTGYNIYGIYESSGTNNFYYNSVYVGGAGVSGTTSSTFGFYSVVTNNARIYRNNIFSNDRSGGTTGKHYSVRVGGTTANPSGLTINNNVYFAGSGAVFGYFNSADVASLGTWRTAVGQDVASKSGNPQFINPTGNASSVDLHINPAVATPVEGNAAVIAITDDYDGNARNGTTPDIGADEGTFTAMPNVDYTTIVQAPASQISAGNVSSLANVTGSAVSVFKLTIADQGSGDGLSTKVTSVKIANNNPANGATWTTVLLGAKLNDGTSDITTGTPTITSSAITFPITSGNLEITDGGSIDLTLKVWLKTSGITDNQTLQFKVDQTTHGFEGDMTGSQFNTDFGSATTGNVMTIEVIGTQLVVTAPTAVKKSINFSLTVASKDANSNTDLNGSTSITLTKATGTGVLSSVTGLTQSLSSGTYSWSDLQYNVIEPSFTITASGSGFTSVTTPTISCVYFIEDFTTSWTGSPTAPPGMTGVDATGGTNKYWDQALYVGSWSAETGVGGTYKPTGASNDACAHYNDYIASADQVDEIQTGTIDLSTSTYPRITFKYAYPYSSWGGALDIMAWNGSTWASIGTYGYTGSNTNWTDVLISVPASYQIATAKFALRVTANYGDADLWVDNFVVDEATSMTYVSSTTTQAVTTAVNAGTTSQQVIGIEVVTSGSANALSATSFTVNANGTTSASDISNAKIFYTGTSSSFATSTQFGSTYASPTLTSFNITGTQTLAAGTNYFWVTYDVVAGATNANVIDGECTSITIGTAKAPSVTAPAGTRAITQKTVSSLTVSQASTATVGSGSTGKEILRVDVVVAGPATGELNLNSIQVTSTNDADADIAALGVKIYRTATTTFATTNQVGSGASFSGGVATIGSMAYNLPVGTTYFWVAYDIAASATNGNSVDAKLLANSINIGGATTHPTTEQDPVGERIIQAPLSGTITVGAGQTYTTLSGASGLFKAINDVGLSGNLIAEIGSDITEDGANGLNQWSESGLGNYTLTIRPDAAALRTISGSYTGGLIRLSGADRVTIDGRYSGSGNYLAFTNSSTDASIAAVQVISLGTGAGATNNTIRNCNISTGVSTTAYGISVGGSTVGTAADDNDNTNLINNAITVAPFGIYAYATATGILNGLVVTGNSVTVSSTTAAAVGIRLGQATGAQVDDNIIDIQSSVGGSPVGISLETGFVSSTLNANKITRVTTSNTGGWGARGITIGTGTASSALTLSNNVIYGVNGSNYTSFGNSSSMGIGIGVSGSTSTLSTTTGGVNLYFNSIYLSGDYSYGSACITAALYVGSGASALDIRNNIFSNELNNTSNSSAKAYGVYSAASAVAFSTINYNDYYGSGSQTAVGYLSSARATISDWRTATSQDVNSISASPAFASTSNLHPTSSVVNNAGVAIGSITTDFEGAARGTVPDMGAYIISSTPAATTTAATLIKGIAATLNGTINPENEDIYAMSFEYGPTISYGSSIAWSSPSASGSSLINGFIEVTGLTHNTLYHFRTKAVGANSTIYGTDQTFNTYAWPTQSTNNFTFSESGGQLTISWTNGDGDGRLIKVNNQNSFTQPTDRTDYAATCNTTWQNAGEQNVYDGTGTSVTITLATGLTAANIWVALCEYEIYNEAKAPVKIYHHGKVQDVNGNGGSLPVELISFNAKAEDKSVRLDWITASEINNSHYMIEKSSDGKLFERIGIVDGKGTTSLISTYTFNDTKPFTGINYYRLVQYDYDGHYNLLGPVFVEFKTDPIVISKTYFNNENLFASIYATESTDLVIELVDVNGKVIERTSYSCLDGMNHISIPTHDLATGNYLLKVSSTYFTKVIKVLK